MSITTTAFSLTRFLNRNGSTSWRVSGWLAGVRIRKNFPTREEGAAEKAALELKTLQVTAGMRLAATFLTDERLRQAEDALRLLEGRVQTLRFCIDYTLTNYRPPESEKPLADAATEYPLDRLAIVPPDSTNMRRVIFAKFELTHDVLRHTFISMFVAKFRSMGEAALQAGNSESIIRKHYLDLKTPAEAEQFFGILPKRSFEAASAVNSGQPVSFSPSPTPLQLTG